MKNIIPAHDEKAKQIDRNLVHRLEMLLDHDDAFQALAYDLAEAQKDAYYNKLNWKAAEIECHRYRSLIKRAAQLLAIPTFITGSDSVWIEDRNQWLRDAGMEKK
jgi:hypothetical protein